MSLTFCVLSTSCGVNLYPFVECIIKSILFLSNAISINAEPGVVSLPTSCAAPHISLHIKPAATNLLPFSFSKSGI